MRRAPCRREAVGIFDVSHMLGVMIRGADRVEFMEKMCVADLQVCRLTSGRAVPARAASRLAPCLAP